MYEVHSVDYAGTHPASTPEQTAARSVGCAEEDGEERTSVLPWVLGCAGFWIIVALAVVG